MSLIIEIYPSRAIVRKDDFDDLGASDLDYATDASTLAALRIRARKAFEGLEGGLLDNVIFCSLNRCFLQLCAEFLN